MTLDQILTKIEMELGYIEMGKKSVNARTNTILAEIGEMKKSQPVETTTRDEAIETIDALYPTSDK